MPQSLTTRARLVLMAADGATNTEIAERLGLSMPTVGIWRSRYRLQRLAGLYDEPKPGSPRSISDEQVAVLLRKTVKTKPKDGTHWSCRSIAAETKISKSTVQRVWKAFGLQPHRQKHFKISTDPFFVEKVRDIVGLYLNPLITPWCCVSTRKAKSRHSIEPSLCSPSASVTSKALRMTTFGTVRPRCSRPWILRRGAS